MKTKKKAVKKVARGTKLAHTASKIHLAREKVLTDRIKDLELGIKGIALSLGWGNVPPIDSLQKDINSKKLLHESQRKLISELEADLSKEKNQVEELKKLCDTTEGEAGSYAADAANLRFTLSKVPAWLGSVALDGSTAGAFQEEIAKAIAEAPLKDLLEEWTAFQEWKAERSEAPEIESRDVEEVPEAEITEESDAQNMESTTG